MMGKRSKKSMLTVDLLCKEAAEFSQKESRHKELSLYGVTDGKAVGTYFENKFQEHLHKRYDYEEGNSAKGIDFPALEVDMKTTSVKQPQSSCPFKSARQKIYGLGYSLLIFVYEKTDDPVSQTGKLKILHSIFIEKSRSGDYQTTRGILQILQNNGNKDDLAAFMHDRNLPVDDIMLEELVKDIMSSPPELGYLTISNALQWRLQYSRVIQMAGEVEGLIRVQ